MLPENARQLQEGTNPASQINACMASSWLFLSFAMKQKKQQSKCKDRGTIAATIVTFHHQEAFTPQGLWNLRKQPWHPDESFWSFSFVKPGPSVCCVCILPWYYPDYMYIVYKHIVLYSNMSTLTPLRSMVHLRVHRVTSNGKLGTAGLCPQIRRHAPVVGDELNLWSWQLQRL